MSGQVAYQPTSISLPADLKSAAKAKAATQNRKFSNYVQHLIAEDLKSALAEPAKEAVTNGN